MLTIDLVNNIAKKIKERKDERVSSQETLEEAGTIKEKEVIISYNPNFETALISLTENAYKKDQAKKEIMYENFEMPKMQKKLENDLVVFEYLRENFTDKMQEHFDILLENILDLSIRLHQETNVTPRCISPAVSLQENEMQKLGLYKNFLNDTIDKGFTRPIREGTTSTIYENQFNRLSEHLIEEGTSVDTELAQEYIPLEESVTSFISGVLIPKTTQSRIDKYHQSIKGSDLNILSESSEDILSELRKKIRLMASVISPGIYKTITDNDKPVEKIAGITIATDPDFSKETDSGCGLHNMDDEAKEELDLDLDADSLLDDGLGAVGKKEDAISGEEANDDLDDLMQDAIESAEPTDHEIDLDVPEEFDSGSIHLPGEEAGEEKSGSELEEDPIDEDDINYLEANSKDEITNEMDSKEVKEKDDLDELNEKIKP